MTDHATSTRRIRRFCWIISPFLGVSIAAAQPRVPQDLIDSLGSSDIHAREEGMRLLTVDSSITLTDLESLLRIPDLNPEQRCRLTEAARQRFMESPRPAMGVRFDNTLPDRVAIEEVYSAFPSSKVLEPGDLIVSCEGEKLRSRGAWIRLGAHIFSHEAGEPLSIVIRRGATRMELQVPLGRFKDLEGNNGSNPDLDRLERAWELRLRRDLPDTARAPINPAMAITDWQLEPNPLESKKIVRFKTQMPQTYRPSLVAGGEPRGGELNYDELLTLSQQNPRANAILNRQWNQQRLAQQGIGPGWSNLGIVTQSVQQELVVLETRKSSIERQIEQFGGANPAGPNLGPQQQTAIAARRADLERIKRQIAAIKAEAEADQAEGGNMNDAVTPQER